MSVTSGRRHLGSSPEAATDAIDCLQRLRANVGRLVAQAGDGLTDGQKADVLADHLSKWSVGRRQLNFPQFVSSLRGMCLSTDGAQEAFVALDRNGNGVVDVQEFCDAMLHPNGTPLAHGKTRDHWLRVGAVPPPHKPAAHWTLHASGAVGKFHAPGGYVEGRGAFDFAREHEWEPDGSLPRRHAPVGGLRPHIRESGGICLPGPFVAGDFQHGGHRPLQGSLAAAGAASVGTSMSRSRSSSAVMR